MAASMLVVFLLAFLIVAATRRVLHSGGRKGMREGDPLDALATVLRSTHPASAFVGRLPPSGRAPAARMSGGEGSILVFGSTGGTGREVVYQALERGETVITLAREPRGLSIPPGTGGDKSGGLLGDWMDDLTVIKGDVTNQADVDAVFADQPVKGVIVVLGGCVPYVSPTMLYDGTKHIVAACNAKGVKRIVVVTSIGCGESREQVDETFPGLLGTLYFRQLDRAEGTGRYATWDPIGLGDKEVQENVVRVDGADLDYTIVRPGLLRTEPPKGVVITGDDEDVPYSITRADVAAFCLDTLLEPESQFSKQTVMIGSKGVTGFFAKAAAYKDFFLLLDGAETMAANAGYYEKGPDGWGL